MKFRDIGYRLRDAFRTVAIGGVITAAVGAFGTWLYGLPNGDNGRKTLERIGAKVVEDKGHPPFGFGSGGGIFSSKFTIENKDGSREDVIVSRGFLSPSVITLQR